MAKLMRLVVVVALAAIVVFGSSGSSAASGVADLTPSPEPSAAAHDLYVGSGGSPGLGPASAAVVQPGDVLIGTIDCDVPGQSVNSVFNNFGAVTTFAQIGDDPGNQAGPNADAIRFPGAYWSIINCETIELGAGYPSMGTTVEIHPLDPGTSIGSLGPDSGIVIHTVELGFGGYTEDFQDDQIIVAAGVQPVSIWTHGWAGADLLVVDPTHPGYVYFDGGAGADQAYGSGATNWFIGGPDNDRLFGFAGDDFLEGSDGNDFILGGAGIDAIRGDAGADEIRGGGGGDFIEGGDGADQIDGQGGSDTIDGQGGPDVIDGRGAADNLTGGPGADVINGQNGGDVFIGGLLDDDMFGQTGPDTFYGDDGNDEMFGGDGADTFFGGAGFDKCSGNTGPDQAEAATCEQRPGVESLF